MSDLVRTARVALVSPSDPRQGTHEFRIECSKDALVYRNTRGFGGVEEILAGSGKLENVPIDGNGERPPLDVIVMRSWADWINDRPKPETSGPQNLQIIGALDALLQSTLSGKTEPVHL